MQTRKKKPATAPTVNGLIENADHGSPRVAIINNEIGAELQANILASRFGFTPYTARALAALVFGEARA